MVLLPQCVPQLRGVRVIRFRAWWIALHLRPLRVHLASPSTFSHKQVVMPSGPAEAKGLLLAAVRDNNPVVFFEAKMMCVGR